jgi:hypothetical protein
MKTLLERLKPEYLELLEADAEKFPYLYQSVKTELSQNEFWTELTTRVSNQICVISKVDFGIIELDSLFNKE